MVVLATSSSPTKCARRAGSRRARLAQVVDENVISMTSLGASGVNHRRQACARVVSRTWAAAAATSAITTAIVFSVRMMTTSPPN